jgi:hypothetical protein
MARSRAELRNPRRNTDLQLNFTSLAALGYFLPPFESAERRMRGRARLEW